MRIDFLFFLNSILFGVGLAMDAFSVSLANGLREPGMKKRRMMGIAGVFGVFQFLMPLFGWLLVSGLARLFSVFQKMIPWIALALLLFIGGKMLWEGIRNQDSEKELPKVTAGALLLQGIATSIDALSVGLTVVGYSVTEALLEFLIIGIITFFICIGGLILGKKFRTKLDKKAGVFGRVILICIGLEIFIKGILFS